MKAKESKSKYQVPNLERALIIMEYLAERPENSTMTEVARDLGYPNNSVFRIMSTLENKGYVTRSAVGNKFALSRKMLALGYQALVETSLVDKSLEILRSLRDATGETVLLGTLLEGEGVVLDLALSHEPIKFMVSPGSRFSLHTAAPAKAMLAFMGEQERERQISMIDFVRFNERTICCAESYRKELELVRQQGYALDKEEEASGIICIGAPVFDYRGHPTAAIWVTGPEFRFPVKKISKAGQIVAEYAEKLSIRLGYHK